VIHHGVPDVPFRSTADAKAALGLGDRTIVSTFGLISRGKGLEYASKRCATIVERHPEHALPDPRRDASGVRRTKANRIARLDCAIVAIRLAANNVKLIDKYLEFDELIGYYLRRRTSTSRRTSTRCRS
jgi:hypothetical protein